MTWVSENSYNIYRNYVSTYCSKEVLKYNIFNSIKSYKGKRIYKCNIKDVDLLLKQEELYVNRDDIEHEYYVGLLLNNIRQYIPNFVSTIGYFKGNPGTKNISPCSKKVNSEMHVRFLLLEIIPGQHVYKELHIDDHFRLLIQIAFALEIVQKEYGFVHYNLHRGNVMMKQLSRDVLIKYPNFQLQTNTIAVIIDFGRSYSNKTGGHELKEKRVFPKFHRHYDIFTYIHSCLDETYPSIMNDLFEFYGYSKWTKHRNFAKLLDDIVIQKYPLIDRSAVDLVLYISKKYNFNHIYRNDLPIYNPQTPVSSMRQDVLLNSVNHIEPTKLRSASENEIKDIKNTIFSSYH